MESRESLSSNFKNTVESRESSPIFFGKVDSRDSWPSTTRSRKSWPSTTKSRERSPTTKNSESLPPTITMSRGGSSSSTTATRSRESSPFTTTRSRESSPFTTIRSRESSPPTERLRLRRTKSTSTAESIITCELKARRRQPDRPIHSPCDSLFSWARSVPPNYDGMINWMALLLIISSTRVALENFLSHGLRVSLSGWFSFLFCDPTKTSFRFPSLYLLTYGVSLPILGALGLEVGLARRSLSWRLGCFLHCLNLATLLSVPVVLINSRSLHFGLISSLLAVQLYAVIFLKLISYIQVNKWCRDHIQRRHQISGDNGGAGDRLRSFYNVRLSRKKERDESPSSLVSWPDNLTPGDLYYFLIVPTLCYELNFPRTARIRKLFLLRRVLELVLGTNMIMATIQQWIIPNVVTSLVPFSSLDILLATERLLKLSLPNHLVWLGLFYLLFHSLLNTVGELTQFGDRDFYHDWWNSSNIENFWKNWNLPVHKWCVRHLYKPLTAAGWSRPSAVLTVFMFSAVMHEYMLSVPLGMFKVWAFGGMLAQVPLVLFSKKMEKRFGDRIGNLVMWSSLILGHPLAVMVYYHDYVIEHFGHSLLSHYGHLNSTAL